MQAGPAAAADWVTNNLPRTHPPIAPESLIVEIGNRLGWFQSPEQAEESAEAWRARFIRRLIADYNDKTGNGRPTRFEFNTSRDDWVQGSSYIEDLDSDELKSSKTGRQQADAYLDFIRTLSGRQFEGVCRGILVLMGYAEPTLTPKGNDQGIDFHGVLHMTGRLARPYAQSSVDRAMRSWIVGQAKQVEGNVGTGEVRDFLGAVELARVGVSADEGQALSQLGMKPFDSVWRMFVTTGTFSRDARKLMQRSGLVAMDGEMVAALLADHEVANLDGVCDRAAFDAWVDSHLPAAG